MWYLWAIIYDDSEKKSVLRICKCFTNTNLLSYFLLQLIFCFVERLNREWIQKIGAHCSMNNEKPWKLTSTMTVMLWVMGPDFLTLSANCSPSFTITAVSTKLTDNWPAASDSKLDSKIIRLIRTLKFITKLSRTSEHWNLQQNYSEHQNWTIRHIRTLNYSAHQSYQTHTHYTEEPSSY